jgi:type 1 glutamine amidotransferase
MRDPRFMRSVLVLTMAAASACAAATGSGPQNGSGGVAAAASGGGSGAAPAGSGGSGTSAGTGGVGSGGAGTDPVGTGGGSGGTPAGSGGGSPGNAGSSGGGSGGAVSPDSATAETSPPAQAGGKVLIFTNSTGYRHVSIEAEAAAINAALKGQGFSPEVSADPAKFTPANLAGLRGIVLVSTTGKPLGDPGSEALAALDAFVQGGGALIGIHAASSTFYDPTGPYTRLIGGKFVEHPGSVRKDTCFPEGTHPAAAKLPASFTTTDEIYVFSNYRADNQVVLRCAALTGNEKLPIAWFRNEGKGRVFNSALGHNADDFAPSAMLMTNHFLPGMLWALGR